MNGKRQTIWLVSMLSLMVVLSAYYLFTEDSGASIPKETAGSIQVENGVKDAANNDIPSVGDEGVVVNEVVTDGTVTDTAVIEDTGSANSVDTASAQNPDDKTLADDQAAATTESPDKSTKATDKKDTAKATDKEETAPVTADKETVKDDAAILDEVASQSVSASSMFNNYLYEREQKNIKNQNDLTVQINDMSKTPAETAAAMEQLNQLQDKESKINGIEEQLQQKFGYGEAIVKEEAGNAYKVIVLSDKLDAKQAVGIVDLVMKELSVTQDKVSVQYVSE
ncbi:SpoIIIAH-like family protein [Paenibacillus sp. sgz500958]|uniref:SpoIIIAH-like family protein n=1 Tax=Paenibacillus sp. sgz500958 TaxID=3242475 RepID=UPI0036D3170F